MLGAAAMRKLELASQAARDALLADLATARPRMEQRAARVDPVRRAQIAVALAALPRAERRQRLRLLLARLLVARRRALISAIRAVPPPGGRGDQGGPA